MRLDDESDRQCESKITRQPDKRLELAGCESVDTHSQHWNIGTLEGKEKRGSERKQRRHECWKNE
jgi:hypothetical protein